MAISALVFWPYLCWVCALLSLADTVVYLDRPGPVNNLGDTLFEPYFNPKSVRATVGERIHFVARFRNIQNSLRTVIAHSKT
jgi:hypothetical protein